MENWLLGMLVAVAFFGLFELGRVAKSLARIENAIDRWSKVIDLDESYRAALDADR